MLDKLRLVISIVLFELLLITYTNIVPTKEVHGDKIVDNNKSKLPDYKSILKEKQEKARQELLKKQQKAQEEQQKIALRSNTYAHYNPNNLREISNASPQLLYNMMDNTAYQSQEMVDLLIKCEESDKPINAVFLLSLMKAESKSGTSQLSRSSNNIASIKGDRGWKYFDSFEHCLSYLIDLLNDYYLDTNAKYYNGTSIWSINKRYCPNDKYFWSKLINQVASEY